MSGQGILWIFGLSGNIHFFQKNEIPLAMKTGAFTFTGNKIKILYLKLRLPMSTTAEMMYLQEALLMSLTIKIELQKKQ